MKISSKSDDKMNARPRFTRTKGKFISLILEPKILYYYLPQYDVRVIILT
jgi:hypothetical protein